MRGDYTELIETAIEHASNAIDEFCERPEGYFTAGGIIIPEVCNGADVFYRYVADGSSTTYPYGTYNSGLYGVLTLEQRPVRLCTSIYEYVNGTWVDRGGYGGFEEILAEVYGFEEGFERASSSYYETVEDGVHWKIAPERGFNNLRVVYLAGYADTPDSVAKITALLAAQVVQTVVSNTLLLTKQFVMPEPILSEQMKQRLDIYKLAIMPRIV
jgi:hypothetical protein